MKKRQVRSKVRMYLLLGAFDDTYDCTIIWGKNGFRWRHAIRQEPRNGWPGVGYDRGARFVRSTQGRGT